MKIAMIGAGSVVFLKSLLTDILDFEELRGAHIALHDIDAERLETAAMMARWTATQLRADPARTTAHADRRAALDGADFVINMVQIGMHEATLLDFEIPRRHGLKQTIGDTAGVGGLFRGLRTIPFMQALCADIAAICPGALLMNYTNPMAMLTTAVHEAWPAQPVVGLCHNIQNTARDLAGYLKVAPERLTYLCAGINHMNWFLRLEVDGENAYPALWRAMQDPDIESRDRVRFELLRRFGRFISESSEHNAEYSAFFLAHEEEIARFDVPVDEYLRRSERNLGRYAETRRKLLAGEGFRLDRSLEYGSLVIHAMVTGQPKVIYGNVRNDGLIENLPAGCCVEVPVLVDRNGLQPVRMGPLPAELAAYCAPHSYAQQVGVRAALTGDRELVHRAALLDPYAASVLPPRNIAALVDDMITAHGRSLPPGILGDR